MSENGINHMVKQFWSTALLVLMASLLFESPVALAQQDSDESPDSSQYVFVESQTPPPVSFLRFSESLHDYYNALANDAGQSAVALRAVSELYPADTKIELSPLGRCLEAAQRTASQLFFDTDGAYENSFVVTNVQTHKDGISVVEYSYTHVALGKDVQHSELNRVYVSENAVLGSHPETSAPSAQCWNNYTQLPADSQVALQNAVDSPVQSAEPDRSSSTEHKPSREPIVSTGQNKWDLITVTDPGLFECLVYKGRVRDEIFDKRIDSVVVHNDVFKYIAYYKDGTSLEIRAHPEYQTEELALQHASNIAAKVGQLPTLLRADIQRIAIMRGDKTAMGDGGGEGIHLQTGNAALRERHNRLEETLFHEAVHTSIDDVHGRRQGWLDAQKMDQLYLTEYGRKSPGREDLAETLLYVYALLYHPERIPEMYREVIAQRIPNRIAYIRENIFNTDTPLGAPVKHDTKCGKK